MRIAIDARSLVTRPTGIGHFLLAAVNVWSVQEPDVDFLLMAHKPLHPDARAALRRSSRVVFHECPTKCCPRNGLWWMLRGFVTGAHRLGATHLWGASGMLPLCGLDDFTTLLTVHDLVFRSMPETMAVRGRIAYGLLAGQAIRRADQLWAVSHFTADEIDRYYPRRRARTINVGSGLNPWRAQCRLDDEQVDTVAKRYHADERTLLFVGTLEPRKNLSFLLKLMPNLALSGWRLLIVGCSGWERNDLASIVKGPDFPKGAVVFCNYVPDLELQALYRSVGFFISTALQEGFGLPHLEALSAGCPVIAPANSAIVEVVGEAGVLVGGWSPKDWLAAIETARVNRLHLRDEARKQAARHDIARTCQAVMQNLRNTDRASAP